MLLFPPKIHHHHNNNNKCEPATRNDEKVIQDCVHKVLQFLKLTCIMKFIRIFFSLGIHTYTHTRWTSNKKLWKEELKLTIIISISLKFHHCVMAFFFVSAFYFLCFLCCIHYCKRKNSRLYINDYVKYNTIPWGFFKWEKLKLTENVYV